MNVLEACDVSKAYGPVPALRGATVTIPVPWHDLAAVTPGGLVVVALAVALSIPALRAGTDLAELRTE